MQSIFSALSSTLWVIFDVISQVFALIFYLFVAGMGLYGMASVVYNLVTVRRRHRAKHPELPTARVARTVYPSDKEASGR